MSYEKSHMTKHSLRCAGTVSFEAMWIYYLIMNLCVYLSAYLLGQGLTMELWLAWNLHVVQARLELTESVPNYVQYEIINF